MLTIDAFKDLCLLAKTKKAKQIRKYYLKLEKVVQELFHEQTQELQRQIDEQKQENEVLQETNKQLIKRVNKNISKREKIGRCVYILKDKKDPTHMKVGKVSDINHRVQGLNCASAEEHIILHKHWYTIFNDHVEQLTLKAFRNFRLANNSELVEIEQLDNVEKFIESLIELLKPYENELEILQEPKEEVDPNFQTCKVCLKKLPIDNFHKSHGKYYQKYCKDCWSIQYAKDVRTKKKCEKCEKTKENKFFFRDEEGNLMNNCGDCVKPRHKQCKKCVQILPFESFRGTKYTCSKCADESNQKLKERKQKCDKCKDSKYFKFFFTNEKGDLMSTCAECYKPNHKQCKECQKILSLDSYSGLLPRCNPCHNIFRKKNKDKATCQFCNKEVLKENIENHQKSQACMVARGELGEVNTSKEPLKVLKIDIETDEVVQEYESLNAASNDTQLFQGTLSRACRDAGSVKGGYRWRFKINV